MISLNICCILIAMAVSANAGLTTEQMEAIQSIMSDCRQKTGATDDDLGTIMKHEIPNTTTGLCFAACVKKTLGILKEDNSIDTVKIEELLATFKQEHPNEYNDIMKVINICAASVEIVDDECEESKKIMECIKEQVEKNQLKIDLMSLISS